MTLPTVRRLALAVLIVAAAMASPAMRASVSAMGPEHATVYRDSYGVPHIYGDTPAAAMYAFGYAQAQDHLSQMRQDYLMAAGRLAETGLSGTTSGDAFMHQLKIPETGHATVAAMNDDDRGRLEAFAAGVNKYITDHPGQPSWMRPVCGRELGPHGADERRQAAAGPRDAPTRTAASPRA